MNKGTQTFIAGSIGLAIGLWLMGGKKEEKPCDCGCKEKKADQEKPDTGPLDVSPKAKTNIHSSPSQPNQIATKPKGKKAKGATPLNHRISKRKSRLRRTARSSQTASYPYRYPSFDYHQKFKGYRKAQVSLYNPTHQDLEVTLWGGNFNEDQQALTNQWASTVLPELCDVQAIEYNPVNETVYLLSQLGNSLWALSTSGELKAQIAIEPNTFPGMSSPVGLAINTNPSSASYGFIYVINSVADTLVVFNSNHEVVSTTDLASRPVDVFYNEATNRVHVLSLLESQLIELDADTYQALQTVQLPYANPISGSLSSDGTRIFIAYLNGDAISIYDDQLTLIENFENVTSSPKGLIKSLVKNQILICEESGQLVVLDTQNGSILDTPLSHVDFVSTDPRGSYHIIQKDGKVLTVNAQWETTAILDVAATHLVSTPLDSSSLLLFDGLNSQFYYDQIQVQGVLFDEDYEERKQDFKFNPALVKHARFSLSGDIHFPTLKLIHRKATGKTKIHSLSMSDYQSPQHAQNIYDVTGLEGSFLDGQSAWQIRIAAGQRITAIIYYSQFKMYRLMPERSRKVEPIM